ncbi:Apoptotic enhancer 1 protein [Dirofilaria immitis]
MYGYNHIDNNSSSSDSVKLIQASNSLKRIRLNGGFLPSKMSHQPIRVVQPPIQSSTIHSTAPRNYQGANSIKYDDLVQTAKQQRRMIDANRQLIHDRETRENHVDNAPIRLAVLRNEILFEEREMARLKMIERETHQAAARRMIAEKKLNNLQMSYTSQEQHLRNVVSQIASLQTQFDVLCRRRLMALNAAREQQQKLMNSQMRSTCTEPTQTLSTTSPSSATTSNSEITLQIESSGMQSSTLTSQHSIPHLKQMNPPEVDIDMLRHIPSLSDSGRPKHFSFDLPYRPRASVEPFQANQSKSFIDTRYGLSSSCPPQLLNETFSVSTFGKDRANTTFADRNSSPSPPKDPYPTAENTFDNKIAKQEERTLDTVDHSYKNLSSSISEVVEKHLPQKSTVIHPGNTAVLDDEQLPSNLINTTKLTRADQISIRPDTLRAAKRRSWAFQDSASCDETEYIRKILLDEQKKGRTHLLVGCNVGNLFAIVNKNANAISKPEIIHEEEKEAVEDSATMPSDYVYELLMKDIQLDELPVEIEQTGECEQVKTFTKKGFVEKITDEMEAQNKTSGIAELIKTLPEKGILRLNKVKNVSRKVVFDPLALLLDAALEGEMDLVKESAAKLPNISACNDEGITALHNAICAGHYEIVRYLVDSFADVNAQDSDGWTPLHCAASCNNLPMVKLLVESGACIFAQTLSDLETPAEKCEEDEDGYEGCQLYLKAADQEAGVVNNGLMYAAYDYDKEQEDELSFSTGAFLRVLEKDVDGKAWWFCEIITEDFITKPETSQREWRRNKSMDEKIIDENHEGTIVEQSLPISVS